MVRHHMPTSRERGPSQRQLRVGEMLRHALADILRRNEIRDPDLDGVSVTITQVKPSPDMRYATVFCEPLGGKNAKSDRRGAQPPQGISARRDGPSASRIKFTPDLRFVEDKSFAEAQKIETILKSRECSAILRAEDDGRRRLMGRKQKGLIRFMAG